MPFFNRLDIDPFSFALGFASALALWWLSTVVRRVLAINRRQTKQNVVSRAVQRQIAVRNYLRRKTARQVQALHIAAGLCPLQDVLVKPEVWLNPHECYPDPNAEAGVEGTQIPFLPDVPELSAVFPAARASLLDVVRNGRNVLVIGEPGTGKTTALASLALDICDLDPEISGFEFAVYFHVFDLVDSGVIKTSGEATINQLTALVSGRLSQLTRFRVTSYLRAALRDGRGLVLIDGLDEAPVEELTDVFNWIGKLQADYPALRLVTVAAESSLAHLPALGLAVVALAGWTDQNIQTWLKQWQAMWMKESSRSKSMVDPWLYTNWLVAPSYRLSPLEWLLRTWCAYTGDAQGDVLETWVEKAMLRPIEASPDGLAMLSHAAIRMYRERRSRVSQKELSEYVMADLSRGLREEGEPQESSIGKIARSAVRVGGQLINTPLEKIILPLIENGFLRETTSGKIFFGHPIFFAYLVSRSSLLPEEKTSPAQVNWPAQELLIRFVVRQGQMTSPNLMPEDDLSMRWELARSARYIKYAPSTPWKNARLRDLGIALQDKNLPWETKIRILAGFALCGDAAVQKLFRQMVQNADPIQRSLGLLGLSLSDERGAFPLVTACLNDPDTFVREVACLAVAGFSSGITGGNLVESLKRGEEAVRWVAAEALAAQPESLSIFEELLQDQDILARRAAVHGLSRIRTPEARKLLEKVSIEDGQWVVRNAAAEVVSVWDTHSALDLPGKLIPVWENAVILAFAGKKGIGLVPGDSAEEVLMGALLSGSAIEQQTALMYLRQMFNPSLKTAVSQCLADDLPEVVKEAAAYTLWFWQRNGNEPGKL